MIEAAIVLHSALVMVVRESGYKDLYVLGQILKLCGDKVDLVEANLTKIALAVPVWIAVITEANSRKLRFTQV